MIATSESTEMNGLGQTDDVASLIQAVEVWTPNDEGDFLQLSSATYGDHEAFREASRSLTFARGEAFPGRVWDSHSPLILSDLYSEPFKRADAAKEAGLTSGLVIPVVEGNDLRAVVLLLCNQTQGAAGAFEIWKRDGLEELGLHGEYYANLQRFSAISRFIKFPRGAGLPGSVWDDEFPRIIDGLTPESGFTRAAGTGADGLKLALGIPLMRSLGILDSVILLLSAEATPMAKRFETWSVERVGETLEVRLAAAAASDSGEATADNGSGQVVQRICAERKPILVEGADRRSWTLGIPIFIGTELRSIVVMIN